MTSRNTAEPQVFDDVLGDGLLNLTVAIELAEQGFSVFPCHAQERRPLITKWQTVATRDVEQIRKWWRKWNNALVGLPCGKGNNLAVVDLDRHAVTQDGIAALVDLGFDPETLSTVCVHTPNEGRHLYFHWPESLTNTASHLPDGIDIRGEGGFVFAPGNVLPDGRKYTTVNPCDLTELPAFPEGLKPPARDPVSVDMFDDILGVAPLPPFDAALIADILPWLDPDSGHEEWLSIGMAIHQASQGSDAGFDLWNEWSARGDKYNEREMQSRWRSFKQKPGGVTLDTLKHLARQAGWEEHLIEFEDYGPEPESSKPTDRIAEFNKTHAVVIIGGKIRIIREGKSDFNFWPPEEIHKWHENDRVPIKGTKRTEPISRYWMRSPRRRQYHGGVVFQPNGARKDQYNLWKGWSVEPDAHASCGLFLDHLKTVVCDGNSDHFEWLCAWMAHLVQRPEEKPGTAVILKGAKGAGKDTVGRYLGALFKDNHVTLAQPEHLLGRFNAHMAEALLLHLEEGFWAGDKQGESVLKNLITCQSLQIERKGIDPVEMPNYSRLLITSNAEWVVPATAGERRYFVLNVSDCRAKDVPYFRAIGDEMKNGGAGALLHFLQTFDLSPHDVRNPPETEGLTEQKLTSLRNVEAWWHEQLFDGAIGIAAFDGSDDLDASTSWGWQDGEITIETKQLHNLYCEWMRDQRFHGASMRPQEFGKKWRKLIGDQHVRDYQPKVDGVRRRSVVIPHLGFCREAFSAHIGGAVEWE